MAIHPNALARQKNGGKTNTENCSIIGHATQSNTVAKTPVEGL